MLSESRLIHKLFWPGNRLGSRRQRPFVDLLQLVFEKRLLEDVDAWAVLV